MCTFITEAERQRRLRSGKWKHARPEPDQSGENAMRDLPKQREGFDSDSGLTPWPEINWLFGTLLEADKFF